MEDKPNRDSDDVTPILNGEQKLCTDDVYGCISCSFPVEIFEINDSKNTVTFKCLNPKEKEAKKTIQIIKFDEEAYIFIL